MHECECSADGGAERLHVLSWRGEEGTRGRGRRPRPRVQGGRGLRKAPRGHATARAPGQRAQVHGHLPEAAHLLLALPRVHLVRILPVVTPILDFYLDLIYM